MKRSTTMLAGAMALSLMAACNRAESPDETRKDVAKAEQKAAANVAEERQDTQKAVQKQAKDMQKDAADMREAKSEGDYNTAMARIEGDYKIAKEKCEALSGDAQSSCKDGAKQKYDTAKAQADATYHGGRS